MSSTLMVDGVGEGDMGGGLLDSLLMAAAEPAMCGQEGERSRSAAVVNWLVT